VEVDEEEEWEAALGPAGWSPEVLSAGGGGRRRRRRRRRRGEPSARFKRSTPLVAGPNSNHLKSTLSHRYRGLADVQVHECQLTSCGFVLQGLLSVVHVPGEAVGRRLGGVLLSMLSGARRRETTWMRGSSAFRTTDSRFLHLPYVTSITERLLPIYSCGILLNI